jgi:hypothetical protein
LADKILEALGVGNAGNTGKDAGNSKDAITTKRTPLLASILKTTALHGRLQPGEPYYLTTHPFGEEDSIPITIVMGSPVE